MPRKKTFLKEKEKTVRKEKIKEEKIEEEKIKKKDYILTNGKRKSAIALVKLMTSGTGKIIVNQKDWQKYFPYFEWQKIVFSPLDTTHCQNIDLIIKVRGGGLKAQAESIRLGISRALVQLNPEYRASLKKAGYLTRDSRIKERKKPGLKRARRAPQWQKR